MKCEFNILPSLRVLISPLSIRHNQVSCELVSLTSAIKCLSSLSCSSACTLPMEWSGLASVSRILKNSLYPGKWSIPSLRCIQTCRDRGYSYAGVQNGNECHCGKGPPPESNVLVHTECNFQCPGDRTQYCGAVHKANVYATKSELNFHFNSPTFFQIPNGEVNVSRTTRQTHFPF